MLPLYIMWTTSEIQYLIANYESFGPKKIGAILGRSMKSVSKKGISLGLRRGVAASNRQRSYVWNFKNWSYDLGYVAGVYLGDGSVCIQKGRSAFFQLAVIDRDFCEAVNAKLKNITGKHGSIHRYQDKWVLRFCSTYFVRWLVSEFGLPGEKKIKLLSHMAANSGLLEGLVDSEGNISQYSIAVRMSTNFHIFAKLVKLLGIKLGPQHKGMRLEKWCPTKDFGGYSFPIKEYARVGLGTYIQRKAVNGVPYKHHC